ncbi:conserved hypothetical protein [Pseudomonas sp. 9AZ]|uniref:hypothetical protein n=1 Tax=Pseudomonas sp. 9AZ TaxID=2653168 RepID=UPI0012EFF722|nr:hypothetical protein [Pseudomonas sp. 9AZ]VXC39449.1 conserved hypothetical protein [Pseudomonas sp. 9AZ]
MTRDQARSLWAIALVEYSAQVLEQNVSGVLEKLLTGKLAEELPRHVNAYGLAQLIGLLLANVEAGERPLLGALRTMNREHFQVLRHLHGRLTITLLSDLPAAHIPAGLRRLRAVADFGM